MTRVCKVCKQTKHDSEFAPYGSGISRTCNECKSTNRGGSTRRGWQGMKSNVDSHLPVIPTVAIVQGNSVILCSEITRYNVNNPSLIGEVLQSKGITVLKGGKE